MVSGALYVARHETAYRLFRRWKTLAGKKTCVGIKDIRNIERDGRRAQSSLETLVFIFMRKTEGQKGDATKVYFIIYAEVVLFVSHASRWITSRAEK